MCIYALQFDIDATAFYRIVGLDLTFNDTDAVTNVFQRGSCTCISMLISMIHPDHDSGLFIERIRLFPWRNEL